MKRGNFLPVLATCLLVLIAGGFIIFRQQFFNSPSPTPNPTVTPTSAWDPCQVLVNGSSKFNFPEIYNSGISWEDGKETNYHVPLPPDTKAMKGCLIKANRVVGSIASDVENYYIGKSQEQKWEIKDAAGGAGASYITWELSSKYFLFRIEEVPGNINLKTVTLFLSK